MSTIINTPSGNTEDSGLNAILAVVLIIVVLGAVALFFIYGLPMIQNYSNTNPGSTNINVTVPANPNPAPTTPK